jgi:hypothetical protein
MHTYRFVLAVGLAVATVAAGCGGSTPQEPARPPVAARIAVVPNLVGIEQSKAHALAVRSGFTMHWMSYVGRLSNGHTTVRCVKIFRQSPLPGERRAVGAQIAVFEIACHTPTGRWHDAAGVPE